MVNSSFSLNSLKVQELLLINLSKNAILKEKNQFFDDLGSADENQGNLNYFVTKTLKSCLQNLRMSPCAQVHVVF